MTLSAPVSMSVVGDAKRVRHLRAAGLSFAVWTFDDGKGDRFCFRQRTGIINVVSGQSQDGNDFSEKIIPIEPMTVRNFHCLEMTGGQVLFFFDDGINLSTFTIDIVTNTVITPVTDFSTGTVPSQFSSNGTVKRFYLRDGSIYMKVDSSPEIEIIDLSGSQVVDDDIIRKINTQLARYIGSHDYVRDISVPFTADINTICCFNGTEDFDTISSPAMPAGSVSYYTFDDADHTLTTLVDQLGICPFFVVGTQTVSAVGQVLQSREFNANSGYFSPDNVNLRIAGDFSISFWIKPNQITQTVGIYSKAKGGEGTVYLESDGSLTFYFGTSGTSSGPFYGFNSRKRLRLGAWQHCVCVRSESGRFVRWYVDGKLVSHETTFASTANQSTQTQYLGSDGAVLFPDAALDEMIIANQAFGPSLISALYAKGAAGQKANTSASGTSRRMIDSGPLFRHAAISGHLIKTANGHVLTENTGGMAFALPSWSTSPAMTIEIKLRPKSLTSGEFVVFGNRVPANSSGVRTQGTFELSYNVNGLITFKFETTTSTVSLMQTGGKRLDFNNINYIAISHTFGNGSSSFLSINGSQIPAMWTGGGGNESPVLLAAPPAVALAAGDELIGIRVSSVAKTIAQIKDHMRGRL